MLVGRLLRKLQLNERTPALRYLSHIGGCQFVKSISRYCQVVTVGHGQWE